MAFTMKWVVGLSMVISFVTMQSRYDLTVTNKIAYLYCFTYISLYLYCFTIDLLITVSQLTKTSSVKKNTNDINKYRGTSFFPFLPYPDAIQFS